MYQLNWIIVMPTMRLQENDKDYAIVGSVKADAPGITYSMDVNHVTQEAWKKEILILERKVFGQEAMIIFDNVFIPWDIFMNGEFEISLHAVERLPVITEEVMFVKQVLEMY